MKTAATEDSLRPLVVQVTIEADAKHGGVYTASQHFARALRGWATARTINFTSGEPSPDPGIVSIPLAAGFLGRRFGWIEGPQRARAAAALAGADFVIIHVPFRFHANFASEWCRRHRVPYAFVPHGSFDPYVFTYRAWSKRAWLALSGGALLREAAWVIFATKGEAEKAARTVSRHRPAILPWPTALPPDRDRLADRRTVLRRHGLPDTTRLLVYLGRMHPMKRPVETAEAFRAARPPGWSLLMVGPEDGVTHAEISPGNGVAVTGPVFGAEKSELLSAADALVLFSHRENFGFVVAEALASGTPVLISDELDLASDVREVGCGWVADGRTAQGRARGVGEIGEVTPEQAEQAGRRGRKWVAAKLNPDAFAAELDRLISGSIAPSRLAAGSAPAAGRDGGARPGQSAPTPKVDRG